MFLVVGMDVNTPFGPSQPSRLDRWFGGRCGLKPCHDPFVDRQQHIVAKRNLTNELAKIFPEIVNGYSY
ncbi:MAG: hypothetical protein AAF743_08960 [Planctomycetota bacterium]